KKTARGRNVPSKRILTGCQCRLTVKTYPGTEEILGRYTHEHSHPTGDPNARFICIPIETRLRIAELLQMGVDRSRVLQDIRGNVHTEDNLENLRSKPSGRNEFVTAADVRQIEVRQYASENFVITHTETIRLDAQDGQSTKEWVENLRKRGELLGFKASADVAPTGSSLASDTFALCLQTKYQRECWTKWGGKFAGLDATHNTT
ncbi:hypothetical protein C8R43DRAFT_835691, partial [Mycena crocata]